MSKEFAPNLEGLTVVESKLLIPSQEVDGLMVVGGVYRTLRQLDAEQEVKSRITKLIDEGLSNHDEDVVDVAMPDDGTDNVEENAALFYVNDAHPNGVLAGILLGDDDEQPPRTLARTISGQLAARGLCDPASPVSRDDMATVLVPVGFTQNDSALYAATIIVPHWVLGDDVEPSGDDWREYMFGRGESTFERVTVENLQGVAAALK